MVRVIGILLKYKKYKYRVISPIIDYPPPGAS